MLGFQNKNVDANFIKISNILDASNIAKNSIYYCRIKDEIEYV